MLIISNLKLNLDKDTSELKSKICKKLRVSDKEIKEFHIYKESIDARKEVIFVYSCLVSLNNEDKYLKLANVTKYNETKYIVPKITSNKRPIIVGFGPTGIFTALILAKAGLKPIVFERGADIDQRRLDVASFWRDGELNPESNVQFGEGGAGTFSDGKLTTRIKDPRIPFILDSLIENGADNKIKYMHHAHIGTDKLGGIVKNIRNEIIGLGGEVHFNSCVDNFIIKDNVIEAVEVGNKQYFSNDIILALGHSAVDTIKKLISLGVYIEPKDFAIGVRVEHPQILIDKNQYKKQYNHPKLRASEYHLTYKPSNEHQVYSFCMCPGGFVVASSSEKNTIVTNGMSYSNRSNKYANSAILVQVKVSDYYKSNILDGLDYQHNIESLAYKLAGNSYKVNACNIKDFINDDLNELIFTPTYSLGYQLVKMNNLFDKFIIDSLKESFIDFDKKIKGFINEGIILGPETRSSSVVRIKRNVELESTNTKNLYPAGEGAGYSGGIMSSFLDGIRVGEKIIQKYS
jgi:uncharacterized FAD-dependent dehydrogenase